MRVVASNQGARSRSPRAAARRRAALACMLILPLLLAACGDEEEPATPTAAAATTTSSDRAPGGGGGSPAAGSAVASPGGALTLGDLADRIDAAWGGVRSFRSVFLTDNPSLLASPVAAASPLASPGATGQMEIIREVVLPDRQRQIKRINGIEVAEAIVIGDRAYVRGEDARELQGDVDDDTWVAIDLAGLGAFAASDPLLARLAAPIASPTTNIPDNLRPQELRPLGPVAVGDRTCQAYAAAATTDLGGRIDLTIAVDDADLPCFVESRSGTAGGRETFEAFDLPLTIEPPATSVAAASPVGTPAGTD